MMTEYEVLELLSIYRSEGGLHVMNFAAVMFGYVAAAYFVGAKLSRLQTYAITFLFCLFLPGPITAAYEAASAVRFLSNTYSPHYESVQVSAGMVGSIAPIAVPTTIVAGWIVSILFMWQIRRQQRGVS